MGRPSRWSPASARRLRGLTIRKEEHQLVLTRQSKTQHKTVRRPERRTLSRSPVHNSELMAYRSPTVQFSARTRSRFLVAGNRFASPSAVASASSCVHLGKGFLADR